jgi:hypothetical protein
VGEQKPPAPQSVSTRQLLGTQRLPLPETGPLWQAHVWPAAQSASVAHWSYVQTHAPGCPVTQRPLVPLVHWPSFEHPFGGVPGWPEHAFVGRGALHSVDPVRWTDGA